MNEYKILTDSTCDLPFEILKKFDIDVVPLSYKFENGEFFFDRIDENREFRMRDFYKRIRNGELSTTSQVNPSEFVEYFEPILQNDKDILYIAFSSGLSGTYNSALIARDQLKEKYADRKVNIVDSRCASTGEGLLIYEAALQKKEGVDIDGLTKWVEVNRFKIRHPNIIGNLKQLQRGGRISAAKAFFGSLLNIVPILHINSEGKLEVLDKKRGMKNAIEYVISQMRNGKIGKHVFVSHADCENKALEVAEMVKKEFGVEVLISEIGSVIGSHTGCGTIAVFYMQK